MGFREQFKKQRQDLKERAEERENRKDEGRFGVSIFIPDKIPKGVSFWRPEKGEHQFDIIPFPAGPENPNGVPEGHLVDLVDLYIHRNVGLLKDMYVCQTHNFHLPDPNCEYLAAHRVPKEEWAQKRSVRYTWYLVWVHDTVDEEKKGIQIFQNPFNFMQEKIDAQARMPRGGGHILYSDWEQGKQICFEIKGGRKFTDQGGKEREGFEYIGHKFLDRNYQIPDVILDSVFSLDSCIILHPKYEDWYRSFYGKEYVAPASVMPSREESRQREDIDESKLIGAEEIKKDENPPEQPQTHSSFPPTEKALKSSPSSISAGSQGKEVGGRSSAGQQCPAGGQFGIDIDKFPPCGACRKYGDCSDETDRQLALAKEYVKDQQQRPPLPPVEKLPRGSELPSSPPSTSRLKRRNT